MIAAGRKSRLRPASAALALALVGLVLLASLGADGRARARGKPPPPPSPAPQKVDGRPGVGEDYMYSWSPFVLFASLSRLFVPDSHREVLSVSPEHGFISGLTSAPYSDCMAYAATSAGDSKVLLMWVAPSTNASVRLESPSRLVLDVSKTSEDTWFHDPMSLSPNKRWLLVSKSEGRREAVRMRASGEHLRGNAAQVRDDLWIVDCAATQEGDDPWLAVPDTHLVSCEWSPSGRYSVGGVTTSPGTEGSSVLLDAEQRSVKVLSSGTGHANWSADSRTAELHLKRGTESLVFRYDVLTGEFAEAPEVSTPPPGTLWAEGSGVCAWIEEANGLRTIWLKRSTTEARHVIPAAGARRLLGWSSGGELLAYVAGDDRLHFCVGAVLLSEYALFLSSLPAMEGFPAMNGECYGTETTKSPEKLDSPEAVLSAWTIVAQMPHLVYVDVRSDGSDSMQTVGFQRHSLPHQDRHQIIESWTNDNLGAVGAALAKYAAEHDGKMPPHASGPELAEDLSGCLDYTGALSSPFGAGGGVRLLLPGGDLNAIRGQLRQRLQERSGDQQGKLVLPQDSDLAKVALAELESDEGLIYILYVNERGGFHIECPADRQEGARR